MIDDVHRVEGTAVFLTSLKDSVPPALLHNLKHNQVLHHRVVLLTVDTTELPTVADEERISIQYLDRGILRITVRYGFMESPDIPAALALCAQYGEIFDPMETSYYLSRETILPDRAHRMSPLRARLFAVIQRNATSASDFFHIPANRVVELGSQIVL